MYSWLLLQIGIVKIKRGEWNLMAAKLVTHFQSLEMKYCSSSNLCSQSSTILSVYRCSIRQDRILHTHTHNMNETWSNLKFNNILGILWQNGFVQSYYCSVTCSALSNSKGFATKHKPSLILIRLLFVLFVVYWQRLSSWRSGPTISNTSTHMGSPFRMCLQAVWMTDSQASFRARSMR